MPNRDSQSQTIPAAMPPTPTPTDLPTELWLQILSHLPVATLLKTRLVNHKWKDRADDVTLWKALCMRDGVAIDSGTRSLPFKTMLGNYCCLII